MSAINSFGEIHQAWYRTGLTKEEQDAALGATALGNLSVRSEISGTLQATVSETPEPDNFFYPLRNNPNYRERRGEVQPGYIQLG